MHIQDQGNIFKYIRIEIRISGGSFASLSGWTQKEEQLEQRTSDT